MFDSFYESGQAVSQIGLMFGGIVLLGLGGLLFFNALYWRIKAVRVRATVVGVAQKGRFYHHVYEYVAPDGKTYRAVSDVGSLSLDDKDTGRQVTLMIFPADPENVRTTGSVAALVIGVILMACGAALCRVSVVNYDFTISSAVVAVGLVLMIALKARRIMKPRDQRETKEEFGARKTRERAARRADELDGMRDAADIRAGDEYRAAAAANAPGGALLMFLGAVAIFWGVYLSSDLTQAPDRGLYATGEVVRIETRERGDGARAYDAVVSYETAEGERREFHASDSAAYEKGDAVTVIYDPDDADTARIDGGAWDWAAPIGVMALGFFCLLWGFSLTRRARRVAGGS